jgi:hypothetical protein
MNSIFGAGIVREIVAGRVPGIRSIWSSKSVVCSESAVTGHRHPDHQWSIGAR